MIRKAILPKELKQLIRQAGGDCCKLLDVAGKLADLHYLDQAEELCYAVLLNADIQNDREVSCTMKKVSRIRQDHIFPEHYILK